MFALRSLILIVECFVSLLVHFTWSFPVVSRVGWRDGLREKLDDLRALDRYAILLGTVEDPREILKK